LQFVASLSHFVEFKLFKSINANATFFIAFITLCYKYIVIYFHNLESKVGWLVAMANLPTDCQPTYFYSIRLNQNKLPNRHVLSHRSRGFDSNTIPLSRSHVYFHNSYLLYIKILYLLIWLVFEFSKISLLLETFEHVSDGQSLKSIKKSAKKLIKGN